MGPEEHLREGCGDESCRGSVAPKGFPTAPLLPDGEPFPADVSLEEKLTEKQSAWALPPRDRNSLVLVKMLEE